MKTWIPLALAAVTTSVMAVTAQTNPYSLHVTGYVNQSVPVGLTLISNPLDTTNNSVGGLFGGAGGSLPEGTRIYLWTGASYVIGTRDNSSSTGWSPDVFASQDLRPGKGAFIENTGASSIPFTFVGEVLQGSLTNHIAAGFQLVASIVPQAGRIDTVLGFPVADGDQVYIWDGTAYTIFTADSLNEPPPWGPVAPVIDVGESFFSRKATAIDWVRYFTVQELF